ncbi:MAG: hypothetical protein WBL37_06320 [Dehalococcoidales bacterium]
MRIIYTFRKKDKFWIVKCASDTTIKESIYKSPIEAVNKFFIAHKFESIENFDIVIPQSVPESIVIHKPRRYRKPPKEIISRAIPVIDETTWGNRPIPKSTIEFKYGYKWIVAIPPYKKQDIYYLNYQLPENNKVVIKYGASGNNVQVINGKLKHDVFIDLGDSQAHVYLKNQSLRIDIFSGQKDIYKNWKIQNSVK